jgi:hypothetical protein
VPLLVYSGYFKLFNSARFLSNSFCLISKLIDFLKFDSGALGSLLLDRYLVSFTFYNDLFLGGYLAGVIKLLKLLQLDLDNLLEVGGFFMSSKPLSTLLFTCLRLGLLKLLFTVEGWKSKPVLFLGCLLTTFVLFITLALDTDLLIYLPIFYVLEGLDAVWEITAGLDFLNRCVSACKRLISMNSYIFFIS